MNVYNYSNAGNFRYQNGNTFNNNYFHHFPSAFLYCAEIALCKLGCESAILT